MKNYKQVFETQFNNIESALDKALDKGKTDNVLSMVEAMIKLYFQFSGMDEPEQEWTEGVSTDNPEEEDLEQKRKHEEVGGFYSL